MHRPGLPRIWSVALILLLPAIQQAQAGTIRRVPSEYENIQAAVTAAGQGDSILIAPGTYTGPGNRAIAFGEKTLFLRGEGGPTAVVIDAEGLANGFTFTEYAGPPPRINGVTVRNGNPNGIYVYMNTPTIINCRVEDCQTGILLADYDGLLIGSTIQGCRNSGVSITTGSVCRLAALEILDNDGQYGGGLQVLGAHPTLDELNIQGNDAIYDGGGIYAESSTFAADHLLITGNRAAGVGGGLRLWNCSANVDTSTVSRNSSGTEGGGCYATNTAVTFDHTILWGNCTSSVGHEISIDLTSTVNFSCSAIDPTGVIGSGAYGYAERHRIGPLVL